MAEAALTGLTESTFILSAHHLERVEAERHRGKKIVRIRSQPAATLRSQRNGT